MAGSWRQIDPRLRGDEHYELEEDDDEYEDMEEETQLGYNPQINSSNYDAQLDHARQAKKQLLQRRFEGIFAKYGRDFEGVGDEIEMETGLIIVDNGHLKNMRHEGDPGYPEAAEFANPPVGDVDPTSVDQDMTAESGSEAESEDYQDEEAGNEVFSAQGNDNESNTTPFDTEDSSAEGRVLAIDPALDNGEFNGSRRMTRSRAQKRKRAVVEDDVDEDEAGNAEPQDLSQHLESLKASMLNLQSKHQQGQGVNSNDIEALGLSIARQLADFVGRDKYSSQPQWNDAKDPVWSYPELPKVPHQPTQRRRLRSPSPLPVFTGPSPGQKSLWAPMQHPQHRKKYKRRRKAGAEPEEEEAEKEASPTPADPEEPEADGEEESEVVARACVNCECTNSLIWRSGPDGDLCNACGMYYYRYGLIRPLEAPSESEESEVDELSQVDPEERHTADENVYDHLLPNLLGRGRYRGLPFKMEDDAMIIKLKEIDRLSWERIAKHFPGRTAYGVQCRYSKKLHNRAVEARAYLVNQGYDSRHDENGVIIFAPAPQQIQGWTDEEDDLLLKLRDEDKLEWDTIAESFPGRNARTMERRFTHLAKKLTKQRSGRTMKKKQPKKRKGPLTRMFTKYTTDEDDQLIYLREVEKLSWADIALRLPGRNAMAMQKRYVRELAYRNQELGADPLVEDENGVLRPTRSKHSRFNREEDIALLHMRNDLGLGWKEIEFKMPGRKWQSLENRYNYITRGLDRYQQGKAKDAASKAAENSPADNAGDADPAQSEDELVQDKEDQSTLAPSAGPSTHLDGRSSVSGILSKELEGDQNPSPQGHGFFSEGDVPFTTEEDTRIRQFRELEKLSWDAIARQLPGRSVAAVSGRYYRHLFPRSESVNPWSRATPVSSFVAEKPLEIASRINLSSSEIASKRTLRWTKEESDLILRYFNQGMDFEQIGQKMPWRTHKAIQHHYSTKLCVKKSTGKLVAPSARNSLLRQAVGNTTRHSMPAQSALTSVIDLTVDDGDDESPSRRDQRLERQTRESRPQLKKLLPRPAPGDEHARMVRKYAPDLCTPTRVRSAPVISVLPHAHPPKTSGVEAYASLLSQYLSGRDSPKEDNTNAFDGPSTPTRSEEPLQPSTTPTANKTTNAINYFTPAAHNLHSHPSCLQPPPAAASSRSVPLFSEHGLSTQRSVIDPRLLEEAFEEPPPPLNFWTAENALAAPSKEECTAVPEADGDTAVQQADKDGLDAVVIDLTEPDLDEFLNDDNDAVESTFANNDNEKDQPVFSDDYNAITHPQDEPTTALCKGLAAHAAADAEDVLEDEDLSTFNDEAVDIDEATAIENEGYGPVPDEVEPASATEDTIPEDKINASSPAPDNTSMHDSGFFDGPADLTKDAEELGSDIETDSDDSEEELPIGSPPPHSWEELLVMAFNDVGSGKSMNVKDMCKHIESRFPYYKNTSAWKDEIHACLDIKPEFVRVSRSRPLWVFKKALQQVEPEKTAQQQYDESEPGIEQCANKEQNETSVIAEPELETEPHADIDAAATMDIDELGEEPVRLITVKSLRERPPKPEQTAPVKNGPGRPRKGPKIAAEEQNSNVLQAEQDQILEQDTTMSDDIDELAPSPEKLAALRASSVLPRAQSVLPAPSNDFERLHAPSYQRTSHAHPNQHAFSSAANVSRASMSEISKVASSVLNSSSPMISFKTPGTIYGMADTPGTSYSTLFSRGRPQHPGVAALRSSVAPGSMCSRSSSVALPNSRKRIVYTPVRDVDGDEDELG